MTDKNVRFLLDVYDGRISRLTEKLLTPARAIATEKELVRCISIRNHLRSLM